MFPKISYPNKESHRDLKKTPNGRFIKEHIINMSNLKDINPNTIEPWLYTIIDNTSIGPEWFTINSEKKDDFIKKDKQEKIPKTPEEIIDDLKSKEFKHIFHVVCEIKTVQARDINPILEQSLEDLNSTMKQIGAKNFCTMYEHGYEMGIMNFHQPEKFETNFSYDKSLNTDIDDVNINF